MFSFIYRKMLNNKWMIASLLIGNILLIGTASSVPLYANATLQRMLIKQMEQYQLEKNEYPGLIETRLTFSNAGDLAPDHFNYIRYAQNDEILNSFGIPLLDRVENLYIPRINMLPSVQREERPQTRTAVISSYSDLEHHIKIIQGEIFSEAMQDGIIEAIVSQRTLDKLNLLVGEVLTARSLVYDGKPVEIKITGVFENSSDSDYYWVTPPSSLGSHLVISHDLMQSVFIDNYDRSYRLEAVWSMLLDYNGMKVRNVEDYKASNTYYTDVFAQTKNISQYKNTFVPMLSSYQEKAEKLNITLWVMQVPVFILLAFFIFMVSKQILIIEQNEISVIKSRGASRRQIITVYIWQSIFVCLASIPVGVLLGVFICSLLGLSNGFLSLIQRTALQVEIVPEAFTFSFIAAFISLLTMTLPVLSYSRVTIVDYKRSRSGVKKALWQKLYLDVLAFGVSIYALYSFGKQKDALASTMTEVNSIDPLLFLSSSLFIIGMGLVLLRLYPYLIKLVFMIGRDFWPPSFYASFLKLIRSGSESQFIMIFLIFTLAAGIFDAKAARTINLNNDDKIFYETGADIAFMEVWADNSSSDQDILADNGSGNLKINLKDIIYTEPDYGKYADFSEVESVTKVLREKVSVSLKDGKLDDVFLMGINTKEFGETAWFREDLFQTHIYNYLNVMAADSMSVLVSSNFRDKYGYRIGDVINFRDARGYYISSPIFGFVDYWPGYVNNEKTVGNDGKIVETENWLIIANLGFIQSQIGLTPYEVWMKTNTPSNNFLYTYANDNKIKFSLFKDGKAEIIASRNDPVLQGINGVLTIGFITTILICATGFLIYWILSICSRVLQFGIFRAMGMSMRSIIVLLINEQVLTTGVAICIGVLVGEVSSRLFVPVIQIAYTAAEQTIPFKIITQADDYVRLMVIIGLMILSCMGILGALISKIKIAQALKLGED